MAQTKKLPHDGFSDACESVLCAIRRLDERVAAESDTILADKTEHLRQTLLLAAETLSLLYEGYDWPVTADSTCAGGSTDAINRNGRE
jgi:hypothetical protein